MPPQERTQMTRSAPVAGLIPGFGLGLWGVLALLAGELLVISLAYQHGFEFTCRDAAPVWFCAFAGRIVPRVLGVLAGLGLPELADLLLPLWRVEWVTEVTFEAVAGLLGWMGYLVQAVPETKVIGTKDFMVAVGAQCSGVEGFLLITVFLTLYIGLFHRELCFPHVLALFPIGLLASWVFNVLRITILLNIGINGQPELAIGAFHSHAGWLAFTLLSILLICAVHAVPGLRRPDAGARVAHVAAPAATFLQDPAVVRILPFIVFMLSALLASTLSQQPGLLYPWRVLAMGAVLMLVLPALRTLPWRCDPLAVGAGIAIALLWVLTGPSEGAAPFGALTGAALGFWVLARVIGTTLCVPIIEELFFRDYLMMRLAPAGRGLAMIVAVAVSTGLFALLHDRWIVVALAGLVFAGLVWRSRNITDAIVAHGLANGLIAAYALMTGAWYVL